MDCNVICLGFSLLLSNFWFLYFNLKPGSVFDILIKIFIIQIHKCGIYSRWCTEGARIVSTKSHPNNHLPNFHTSGTSLVFLANHPWCQCVSVRNHYKCIATELLKSLLGKVNWNNEIAYSHNLRRAWFCTVFNAQLWQLDI